MPITLAGTGAGWVTTNTGASGTALSVARPANTATGHLMVAIVATRTAGATFTPPAGWTQAAYQGANSGQAAYIHTATASEGASYSFTANSSGRWQAGIFLVSGAAGTLDVTANSAQGSGNAGWTAPSATTTEPGGLLVFAGEGHHGTDVLLMTPPTGMTEVMDFGVGGGGAGSSFIEVATEVLGPVGATGTRTATASGTSSNSASYVFVLKAAAALVNKGAFLAFF